MANRIRSEDFLPEIFQTPANKQLLRSTLDQLTQNPTLKPTEGYIGRKVGQGVNPKDSYVLEATENRTNYQLEPGVVQLKTGTSTVSNAVTYPGIIDSLELKGSNVTRHDRLFNSEHYSWDPMIDFDKFVNFGQYVWVPEGPDDVDVFANAIPIRDDFDVTDTDDGYTFSGEAGTLPTLTLARQGTYTFNVNNLGQNFWIQSVPGTSGVLPQQPNQSSRDVLGVENNGDDVGTVTFKIPTNTAQNFFFTLTDIGSTDLVEDTLQFNQVNNQYVDVFLAANGGIDGITDLQNRTLIFATDTELGWVIETPIDEEGGFDEGFDSGTPLVTDAERYVQWRINFNYADPARPFMELTKVQDIANLSETLIEYGTDYAGVTFYKNAEGTFERQPLITANLDILYYQDQSDETNFGVIRLVDQPSDASIIIDDILGHKNYTSPNGVVFTNGLKVRFIGATTPTSYQGNDYYIEGVGTAIELLLVSDFITPEKYTKSSSVPFDSTGFDEGNFDSTLNAPTVQDYMTINRASLDRNAWARSNRWFHIDVLNATATYNNVAPQVNNDNRAKRPILEFRKSLKLFDYGTEGIAPIDIIDFGETDAFSNINGTIGYSVDGYSFISGSRVIFAADLDPEVRNKIYEVKFVQFDDSSEPVIDLQPASLTTSDTPTNSVTVVTSGSTLQGNSYWFDGTTWVASQQKTDVNQAPLFDVYDSNGYSFGDNTVYPSTTFVGSKIFSYALGTGATDTIIEQPLKYLTIANVGDIVFDNNLYVDTFVYVKGTVSVTTKIDTGVVRQYNTITTFDKLLGWQTSFTEYVQRQSFSFDYTGLPLVLDVVVLTDTSLVPVKVFVNGTFVLPEYYSYTTNADGVTEISFASNSTTATFGDSVEVQVLSNQASSVAFYTIPDNLESNAMNENTTSLTLGTIRNHYGSICENLENLNGKINGANNVRDLGNVVPYGALILQHSAPLTMTTPFITDRQFDYFRSAAFNASEYNKTKEQILNYVARNDFEGKSTADILDAALFALNQGKNEFSPFYYTDTIPGGSQFETTTYTVSPITTNVFDTLYSYDMFAANYAGILVYYTPISTGIQTILVGSGQEYTVAADGPRITINTTAVTLAIGDKIIIREYKSTLGSFVPSTPSSMGLYQIYKPQQFLDTTYVDPQQVIQGHDGSLTVAYEDGDYRNAVLLEFEKRIYNNIKIGAAERATPPISSVDVIPGQFRTTDYTLTEVNDILNRNFLTWDGAVRLPYKDQTYIEDDAFTWNYSQSSNRLTGAPLLGGWRAIYFQLYDTDSPHTTPWEMVGLTERPTWWNEQYGPAPYTSGNLVLWNDMAAGLVADPIAPYIRADYVRPGLLQCIPTDSQGNLLPPIDTIVGNYDQNSFKKSWVAGDMGPVETVWRRSSYYPFAIQELLALTKPASYFSLFADRDLWKYNTEFNQYLYNNRFRIDPSVISIYGNGVIKNSYINWIVDYNRVTGLDSTDLLETKLDNMDIRLCYRMGAFSDQNYLKIFTEKSSPNSLNSSLLLPDESYQLFLYKNPAFNDITWSSVIVQRTATGYSVSGYSQDRPYFEILKSLTNGNFQTITVANQTARVANDYSNTVVQVPYGYEFTSASAVVDFLNSYGAFLTSQGMTFDNSENGVILNWGQMAQEFLYWVNQSWTAGSLINLNPGANQIKLSQPFSVVEGLSEENINDIMLDQNFGPMTSKDFAVERLGNELKLVALNNQTFSYLNARFTSYEHIIVFDNTSIFNDLIYEPKTAARQARLLLNGFTVFDWNGTLDAQGFILNQDNIEEWVPNVSYTKGQIVEYKNAYWSATKLLSPNETFVFADWIRSDYERIQTGLLPNLATKADSIRNNYDANTANLESDADLLGFGLIGFRPRQYMQNLNLDDISQVGLYRQFLATKGTLSSAEIFTSANLGKEEAEYNIFENWAIQRGLYGANANRSYFELRLDESKLLANPSTIAVIDPGDVTTANQTVLVDNLWRESYKITNKNILPVLDQTPEDLGLPTAGYVNYDDVAIKVFDYDDLTAVINSLDNISVGTNIWVAKANSYDWNIYRTNLVSASVVSVFDNLNNTCTVTFDVNHGLLVNDRITIKYFNDDVDGAYIVDSVPGLKQINIILALPGETTSLTGDGICFELESVRVAQAADVAGLSFATSITAGNQVWVDDDGTGNWVVYQKIDPFASPTELVASTPIINNLFGSTITQGLRNQGALIGAPGSGGVYAYNKAEGAYVGTTIIIPSATGFSGFGSSLASGKFDWAVAGAPASNSSKGYAVAINRDGDNGSYRQTQLFIGQNVAYEFGYAVAVSDDERWMYISEPADNKVYAYTREDVQSQVLDFTGDGTTVNFTIEPTILVDTNLVTAQTQLGVTKNNNATVAGSDWSLVLVNSVQTVQFAVAPNDGDTIRIIRLQSQQNIGDGSTVAFDIGPLFTANDIYGFSVFIGDTLQRPTYDYTFAGTTITFTSPPSNGTLILTKADTHWDFVSTISAPASVISGGRFGNSLATTTDGRQILIGAPNDTVGSDTLAGTAHIIDRSVQRFQVTNAATATYTVTDAPVGTPAVILNGTYLIAPGNANNAQYSVVGSAITIGTTATPVVLQVGDIIEIETNTFRLMQTIQSPMPGQSYNFAKTVDVCPTNCSLYLGMPNDSAVVPEGGSVERWMNQARLYGTITGTIANPVLTVGNSIRINNYYVTLTGTTVASLVTDITALDIPNVVAFATSNGELQLTLENVVVGEEFIKLQVLPGTGTAFADLGMQPIMYAQTLVNPVPQAYGHFGASISISDTASTLAVGAPDATALLPTTFDTDSTYFDSKSLNFLDPADESGVVYTFDFLNAASASATNPGKFVFGQQIFDTTIASLDKFGTAVSYVDGILLIGAPNDDLNDSSGDFGRVSSLLNELKQPAWKAIYNEQPIVNASLLNSVFTYDKISNSVTNYLDFIDPLQGKILGAAQANINYTGGIDPAAYNTGTVNNFGSQWNTDHLGEFWWDLSTVRFIDYHQDTIEYRSRRWGQLFDGSSVDVYEWTENSVPPAQYTGPGTVFSTTSYTITSALDSAGTFITSYYYWVKGLTAVPQGKTLSSNGITQYIDNPRSSGVSYVAAIAQNTVALYNCRNLISATDTILHIEFDKISNTDNVHAEYDLITVGNKDSFLSGGLYRKFLDSYCGEDTLGNLVPDATLGVADKYGVSFRPRQSFFVDRFLALENYLTRANKIMALYPVTETKKFDLLNSEEPVPTSASGEWDQKVATYAELTYQDLRQVAVGFNYLVESDSTQEGLWTIYTVIAGPTLQLARVQNYDTKLFWYYVDWKGTTLDGTLYSVANKPEVEVAVYSDLLALQNLSDGEYAQVAANSFNKIEIYQYSVASGEWTRVYLEDGTIAISETIWDYSVGNFGFDTEVFDAQRFDQAPTTETRQILKALNQEIFTTDLEIFRNELLILTFEFIMTEQAAPDWLFKTSLIDVNHKIRDLIEYPIFRRDNQDFVSEYIKEVKPYHVQIREFNLRYEGEDTYLGNTTDFDLPAYYDQLRQQFISPILDENVDEPSSLSSFPSTAPIWETWPYSQWITNYKLKVASVTVIEGGSGYTVPPQVIVTGDAVTQATMTAKVNSAGVLVSIVVDTPGSGYVTTPILTISGGNGSGATAVAVLTPNLVRDLTTTIKYDRITYTSQVKDWTANTAFTAGELVRFPVPTVGVVDVTLPEVYSVTANFTSEATFNPENYTKVGQDTLDGADRTIGLYTPDPSEPGRELAQVMTGIDYPGVQVTGPNFNQNTGFDVGNFDINPFDNLDFGPEGLPTYDPAILDVIYESAFSDSYLGIRATDINVEGGGFIDTYSSHAPEELVPGSEFDTLDLKVYTRPGSDWNSDGHGFDIKNVNALYTAVSTVVSFGDLMLHPVGIDIVNNTVTQNISPSNYVVDWVSKTLTVNAGATVGDILGVTVWGIGGGSQLYKESFVGSNIKAKTQIITVTYSEIVELVVFINGEITTDYTYAASGSFATAVTFTTQPTLSDWVTIVALGATTPIQYSWSTPQAQYFDYDGSSSQYPLTNSLQGTNIANMIVERNGFRLRPPSGIEYTGDGSSLGPYYLATADKTDQNLISDNDVLVYVDNVQQNLALDFTLSTWDGSSDRYVEFTASALPAAGADIKIAVTTEADYTMVNTTDLNLRVSAIPNAEFTVYTFNDTAQQDILTKVFVGPTTTGVTTGDGFDEVPYDSAGFDLTVGTTVDTNDFALGRLITDPSRISVTLNGDFLQPGSEFTISTGGDGLSILTVSGSILGAADVLAVTMFTMDLVPDSLNFRIFQDMLGNEKLLRLNTGNTTELAQAATQTDDVLYFTDVTKLSEPNLASNIFGQVMVGAERITYRERNDSSNSVSGLRRGTAGTGASAHAIGTVASDVGPGEQLPSQYQEVTTTDTTNTGDGTTTRFITSITVPVSEDSTEYAESIKVTVAGKVLTPETDYTITGTDIAFTEITLTTAPAANVDVWFSKLTSKVMYAQGASTASNGIALQEQTTPAALFLKDQG